MLNRDETRRLFPILFASLPASAAERIEYFLGDNHLCLAAELREAAEAKQNRLWKALYEAEILPAARRGFSRVTIKQASIHAILPGAAHSLITTIAVGHGVHAEARTSGGRGKPVGQIWEFSWGPEAMLRIPQKFPVASELTAVASKAQQHRTKNVWNKFFNAQLLPQAKMGCTSLEVSKLTVDRYFNPAWNDDFVAIAEGKAVSCESINVFTEDAARSQQAYALSWNDICLSEGGILLECSTGVRLLTTAVRARMQLWEQFFRKRLMPVAERGMTDIRVPRAILITDFPFLAAVEDFDDVRAILASVSAHRGVTVQRPCTERLDFTW